MANRALYALELSGDDAIIVYRTDNNYGRQGVVFKSGLVRLEYAPHRIPQYIRGECKRIFKASKFELDRGYTLGGYRCQLDKIRGFNNV